MPNRAIKNERDVSQRAGAPGRGSLFGKREPPPRRGSDPATRDLSVIGAAIKLRQRRGLTERAIEEAAS